MGALYNLSVKQLSSLDEAERWRLASIIVSHVGLEECMAYYIMEMMHSTFAPSGMRVRHIFDFYKKEGHKIQQTIAEEHGLSVEAAQEYYRTSTSTSL